MGKKPSHTNLKKLIGIIAISLPIILYLSGRWLFDLGLQSSFSLYYYTTVQDIFVGYLCVLGILLCVDKPHYANKGYLAFAAGLLAFMIALLPAAPPSGKIYTIIVVMHSLGAVLFFGLLATLILTTFKPESLTAKTKTIYTVCAYSILLTLGLFILLRLSPTETQITLHDINTVFWLEMIATWAFGIAWLTKSHEHPSSYNEYQ